MDLSVTESADPELHSAPASDRSGASGSLSDDIGNRPSWPVLFGALLLAGVAAVIGMQGAIFAEFLKQEVWVSSGSLEIRDGLVMPESAKVVLESPGMWHPVAEREGITDRDFQEVYSVDVAGATQIVQVSFEDTDQERANRIVSAILASYVDQFSAPEEMEQSETLEQHLLALEELESSLVASLEQSDDLPRLQQIDLQNVLVRTRQQITSVVFRMDTRTNDLLERRNVDPRIATPAFILEEPVTPDPLRAAVFGTLAGGLVGVAGIYLIFHRDTYRRRELQPATASNAAFSGDAVAVAGDNSAERSESWFGRVMKRTIDVAVSSAVLMGLSPLLLVVAVAIKTTSRGPVLFRQDRIGQDDRLFVLLKFRTMQSRNDDTQHREFVTKQLQSSGDEPADDGRFKLEDNRVTAVGRPLRRFSIDEIPQLWNVLKGEMSLVGPRPALPWETELFQARYRERSRAVPGCTGLWQVSGRSNLSASKMLELDVEYVRTRGLLTDLKIILRTPMVVLRGDGAR